jgi:hypothetical protein
VQDPKERQQFFKFIAAPKDNPDAKITVLFVSRLGVENNQSAKDVAAFVADAHRRSIRVDYLCGDASYILPEHRQEGLWQLDYVLKYNRQVSKDSRFDGIQYDVEPYAIPGWPGKGLYEDYLSFLSDCRDRITKSGQSVKLGVAIPRWFDAPDLHGLYKTVLDRVDYVAVMDYVDRPESFVKDAANTVDYASTIGKQAWLGAEASQLPDEPHATFYSLGNRAMEGAFQAAKEAYSHKSGFAGVAVEYYETYLALKP